MNRKYYLNCENFDHLYSDWRQSSNLTSEWEMIESLKRVLVIKDFLWNYALPLICLFGILTNSINVRMFVKKEQFSHEIYKYLLAHSSIEVIYLSIALLVYLMKSKYLTPSTQYAYAIKVAELVADLYLTCVLALLLVFIEFIISIKRLLMIFNLNLTINMKFYKTLIIYFALSVLLNLPVPLTFKIKEIDTNYTCHYPSSIYTSEQQQNTTTTKTTRYDIIYDNFEENTLMKATLYFPAAIRAIILPVVLVISNLIIFVDFKKNSNTQSFRKSIKSAKSSENQLLNAKNNSEWPTTKTAASSNQDAARIIYGSKKNLTKLVISINFLFIMSNVSSSIAIFSVMIGGFSSYFTKIALMLQNTIFLSSHSLSFFVYLYFDSKFNQTVKFHLCEKFLSNKSASSPPTTTRDI